ncbi:MAG TPA: hypothetical protein VIJ51_14900 [Solirubrobacteraceae bacterium]
MSPSGPMPVGASGKLAPYTTATYLWGHEGNLAVADRLAWAAVAPPRLHALHGAIAAADETDLRASFQRLADQRADETWAYSFVERKAMNRAYQRTIALGPRAVPLILERLVEQGPDHWYWALEMLTGSNPAEGAETMADAAERWLAWGRHRGLI